MFAAATRRLVSEVDDGGSLLAARSPDDSAPLLAVVLRRRGRWFWQKARVLRTDLGLNDLLAGAPPIRPVVMETDFIGYDGSYVGSVRGDAGASVPRTGASLRGEKGSRLRSSFGSLKKQELEVQKLLADSRGRVLDMNHRLIQQTGVRGRKALAVVKERIVTREPCWVVEEVRLDGRCGATFDLCGTRNPKFSLKENGSLSSDTNVTMEIPANTALAYALLELEVKHDGRYEFCLTEDSAGGFEVDGPLKRGLPGASGETSGDHHLSEELDLLAEHFQLLSALPGPSASSLLQRLLCIMEEPSALDALQEELDQMFLEDGPSEVSAPEQCEEEKVRAVLDLLEAAGVEGLLEALHLLVSALSASHKELNPDMRSLLDQEALSQLKDEALAALTACCSPAGLELLPQLVERLAGGGRLSVSDAMTGPAAAAARRLLATCDVTLEEDRDSLRTAAGARPLVACIAIRGLCSLARPEGPASLHRASS